MYTIILAGGSGTRLFPLSRSKYPKQFIPLIGKESLFQKTIKRALLFSNPEDIYIIANEEHKFLIENQLLEINKSTCNILLEPNGKNTLPAILYGTLEIAKKDENATILVLSSDQLIEESEEYNRAIRNANSITDNYIVTFGIVPSVPHTGYGYIKPGKSIKKGFEVSEFKEKPDANTAKKYVIQNYLWNAGIFCFSAKLLIEECKKYSHSIYTAFSENTSKIAYELSPKISIDYGLLEKSSKIAVIPMKIDWNDLGSFESLYSIHEKDINQNATDNEYLAESSANNLIISDKLVTTIGINNLAIVDTPDVLLICPRNQSQNVSHIVDTLNSNGDERAEHHTTVNRPWGTYTTLLKCDTYLIKRLIINPHRRISLQYHCHRSEHWVIVNGSAEITNGEITSTISTGESTFIPAKTIHRLANNTDKLLEVIEVQQGYPLNENDITRIDDDYKRY